MGVYGRLYEIIIHDKGVYNPSSMRYPLPRMLSLADTYSIRVKLTLGGHFLFPDLAPSAAGEHEQAFPPGGADYMCARTRRSYSLLPDAHTWAWAPVSAIIDRWS
jgi:hypothetical protein